MNERYITNKSATISKNERIDQLGDEGLRTETGMTGELSHTEKEDHCGHDLSAFAQEDVKSRRTKDSVIVFGGTIFDRRLNSSLQLVGDLVVDSSSLGRERYSFNDEIDRR